MSKSINGNVKSLTHIHRKTSSSCSASLHSGNLIANSYAIMSIKPLLGPPSARAGAPHPLDASQSPPVRENVSGERWELKLTSFASSLPVWLITAEILLKEMKLGRANEHAVHKTVPKPHHKPFRLLCRH